MTTRYRNNKIHRKIFLMLSMSVLLSLTAGPASAEETLEPLIPYRTDAPPVIDGKLDDPVWQQAPSETGFKTYHPEQKCLPGE